MRAELLARGLGVSLHRMAPSLRHVGSRGRKLARQITQLPLRHLHHTLMGLLRSLFNAAQGRLQRGLMLWLASRAVATRVSRKDCCTERASSP